MSSRESSSSRFSGSLKPGGSRTISPNDAGRGGGGGGAGRSRKHDKSWKECAVIEEEGLLDEEEERRGMRRRCYLLAFLLGFFVLFSFFSLVLWGASRNQKPEITMKTVTFEDFGIQAGTDDSGVPTDMVNTNATMKLNFRNTATFFGVHVTSTPVDLSYSQLKLASGNINNFYQSRKQVIPVVGNRIPLYAAVVAGRVLGHEAARKPRLRLPLLLLLLLRRLF